MRGLVTLYLYIYSVPSNSGPWGRLEKVDASAELEKQPHRTLLVVAIDDPSRARAMVSSH